MTHPPGPPSSPRSPSAGRSYVSAPEVRERSPSRGVAAGLALVLAAVLAGMLADRPSGGGALPAAAVAPTGDTTTVRVVADRMRYTPDTIEVPAGDRLVIELVNQDRRRHDLVFSDQVRTPLLRTGESATLDLGVVGAAIDGWCSLPGHRQAGMTLTVVPIGAPAPQPGGTGPAHPRGAAPSVDPMRPPSEDFRPRDPAVPVTPTGRVHRHELTVREVVTEVAPGVHQRLWTFDGTAPGPVLRGKVGDTFVITLRNDGTLDHGIDFHAGALAPDEPMRPIDPGEELTYTFTAERAGVFMYHCSTMPMLHHIGNGMYGAVIIDPPSLPPVDAEYLLVQSEFYLGAAGEVGDLAKMRAERPDAVVFNGYAAQYAHRPLTAHTGDRVRVWLLNAGPNRSGAFHVVGTVFDTVYREGRYELTAGDPGGAQVLDLAPAAGGFVETVFPQAGTYPFLSHSMVDAERGATGTVTVTDPPAGR